MTLDTYHWVETVLESGRAKTILKLKRDWCTNDWIVEKQSRRTLKITRVKLYSGSLARQVYDLMKRRMQ